MVHSTRSVKMSRRFLEKDFKKLENLKASTAAKYYITFLTLEEAMGNNPLVKLFNGNLDSVIEFIDTTYELRGERFKSLLVTILKIPKYNNLLNEEDVTKLRNVNIKNIKENKEIAYNKTTTLKNLIKWDDFVNRVNSYKLNEKSKLKPHDILLMKLYINRMLRDDYGGLNLIKDNDNLDNKKNYYNINTHEIILNEYKTNKKYGRVIYRLPDNIVNFIKKYNLDDIKNKYLIVNKYLNPYSELKLTTRIRQILNKLYGGVNRELQLSINTLRQSKITQLLDTPGHTYKERENLADEMLSSVDLQSNNYKRVED